MYLIGFDVVHSGTWMAQVGSLFVNLVSFLFVFPFICSFKQISEKTLHTAPPTVVPHASKDLAITEDTFLGPFWTTASWFSPRKQRTCSSVLSLMII